MIATSEDTNNNDGKGATGNEVDDDGDGATGDGATQSRLSQVLVRKGRSCA
jgi:hypothetical protein